MVQKPELMLKELGSKLHNNVPTSEDALIKILKQAATVLSELDQSPPKSVLTSMHPFVDAIAKLELLKHQDREVKLLVATCICELTRISAPEAPYSDEVLKEMFHLIVSTFSGLADICGPSFGRRVVILEILARYKSCVVMLDLECDDLVKEMFSTFLAIVSDGHPESVLQSMQTIMVVLLEESEEIHEDLLFILLSVLGWKRKDIKMASKRLSMNVIQHCSEKLEPGIRQFLISSMSGDKRSSSNQIDYQEVIYDIYRCAPQVLSGVVPYLTGELLTDKIDIRLKAVELVGELFGLPDSEIYEAFQPIFLEFLKRLTDRVVEVRMSVLKHVKNCLLSNPSRAEAPQIIYALHDRLLDYDESIRKQVVAVVCDVACSSSLTAVPVEAVKLVAERLKDKSLLVKKYTMERLADIYSLYCLKCSDGSTTSDEYDWIPGKILGCFYDKDFRSDTVESILCSSLFPPEFSAKDKVRNWVRVFSELDKVEIKVLEKILEQKQRLQQEMLRYLSLRQIHQENDTPEIQKKLVVCFRIMSRCFTDSEKAEENFLILDQLKDANVWRILTTLLDPNTTCTQTYHSRGDVLKILGEKHRLYEFLSSLSLKCSNILFSKEHVKEILLEVDRQKLSGNAEFTLSCMNILVMLACSSPSLLSGIEEDLVQLLEDENEVIKEGVLHILAKAGGTIRDQLGVSSSSLDLILERICLEGSRRQAKYAVHALAAVSKDDGLMSLSVLYKRLVDMLKEKANLPAVLQSLGCIAQTAMPIFETRENEIECFIKQEILMCNHISENKENECWDERSELCSLKIFGWKTLVKSYLPVRDAHLRPGIDDLLGMLRNIVSFGEISKDIKSSSVDKAHLKLAGAKSILRLSKHWDHKIPTDLFYLTLKIMEVNFPQIKKQFLSKVHQYLKDRLLDPKYACAFLYDMGSHQPDYEEEKHKLFEIIQMCHQGKARQQSVQSDATSSVIYPEFILPYLVHALAHHFSCPSIDESKDVKSFEPIYRKLYLFLSMLIHGDEDGKSEVSVNKKKETILLVNSILHGIKRSEDLTDTTKSTKSHAICDLGLSIIKLLAPEQDKLQEQSSNPFLPPGLYKEYETKEGDEPPINERKTWLADDSVLAHFESLQLEANGPAFAEIAEDDEMKDSETDLSEVPLGKMIKRLRAKGIKAKKVVKDESIAPEVRKENEFDILKMVREIDSDNVGLPGSIEPSNSHEYVPRKAQNDLKHKKNKRLASESENFHVTKRCRSSSAQGHHKFSLPKGSLKGLVRPLADGVSQKDDSLSESAGNDELHHSFEERYSLPENATEAAESDRPWKSSGFASQSRGRDYTKDRNEVHEAEESFDKDLEISKKPRDTNSIYVGSTKKMGSLKKSKRKSVAGLAKCNTKEGVIPTTDIVDCRLKIWWPMDKKFYEGVVKSYDQKKNKHVIKYDDGDVEVLCLDKERWELVVNGQQAIKRVKLSKDLPAKRLSAEQRKKSLDASTENERQITSPPSKVRGKRTPKKNLKHRQTLASKSILTEFCEEGSKQNLDISEPEPAKKSKPEDFETEENQSDGIKESISVHVDPVKHDNSVIEEHREEDAENNSRDRDASKEDVTRSEETQESDESKEKCSEISNEIERFDLRGNEAEVANAHRIIPNKSERTASDASDSKEAEISDDEPLGVWKSRAGKLVEYK